MRAEMRHLAILGGFAMLCAGAFQPLYFQIFRADRARLTANLTELPYSKLPGYRQFLEGVRERTAPGESILILLPMRNWRSGYEYPFGRASYVLAGRTVLPTVSVGEQLHPGNIDRAEFIAAWGPPIEHPSFRIVWSWKQGTLLRRIR